MSASAERRRLVVLVVAREDEAVPTASEREPAGREQDEWARVSTQQVGQRGPLSSAFAMKPRAPLCSISPP